MPNRQRLLLVQVAALGYDALTAHLGGSDWEGLTFRPADSIWPAVTCPVQATMRTGRLPREHGMVFNGHYVRELRKPLFWEQSSALVEGPRLWDRFRHNGGTVGMLFWQQSLGEDVDVLLSPAPIHTHGGGLIDTVYSRPHDLYANLCRKLGKRFKLSSYWGPLARMASTDWISMATQEVMRSGLAPDLLLTYLPHLDYDLQKHGGRTKHASRAFTQVLEHLQALLRVGRETGYAVVIFGDYAITDATDVLYPNRHLRDAGLLQTREIRGRTYPDLHASRAFAVVDHEVAHVYLRDPDDRDTVVQALAPLSDRMEILHGETIRERGLDHPRSGTVVLAAQAGAWLAYPWWTHAREAPDYATHVDIHNKPGYDPCELFFGWHPFAVGTDPSRVGGTHGRVGPDRRIAWTATVDLGTPVASLLDLAQHLESRLDDTTR